jgi:hypothetical protein
MNSWGKNARTPIAVATRYVVVPVFLLCMLCSPGSAQTPENAATGCKGDTVDRMGPEIASQSRAFLGGLQAAVRADDLTKVARMVQYPLKVIVGDKRLRIKSRAVFLRDYAKIMTPHVKKMLDEQTAQCLFGNSQGFMVGDGEIWFTEMEKGVHRIISVNTNTVAQ